MPRKILITQPILPSLRAFKNELSQLWWSKWLTNMGKKHVLLENRLRKELEVPYVSVFNNGTIALLAALKALDLPTGSEVITSPFTFPATAHCISWNGLKPVFCDIEPETMTLDPKKIDSLITKKTSAILGIHVYGFPCKVKEIASIAKQYHLRIIYDGAHAFSTHIRGEGIGNFGDITMFSFHATKLYHTIEGGCLTYRSSHLQDKIYNLRNFGIRNEEEVVDIGINGKMNEFQAAMGLLNLSLYRKEKLKRKRIRSFYNARLNNQEGISVLKTPEDVTDACTYFPVIIEKEYPLTRDETYLRLKQNHVYARKYFYPLCSDYLPYRNLKSSSRRNLPVANQIKNQILCLPFHGGMTHADVDHICSILRKVN